ncbi:hypothetical protein GCM10009095_22400 [Sphingomonas molluscorum]|nr:hypothetical protein GCM10017606_08070 [Microbacterium terregens]
MLAGRHRGRLQVQLLGRIPDRARIRGLARVRIPDRGPGPDRIRGRDPDQPLIPGLDLVRTLALRHRHRHRDHCRPLRRHHPPDGAGAGAGMTTPSGMLLPAR